ncbi:MAG: hypothetical protein JSW33_07935 [bacterium]|nr:MAG: hypothetical protein JSW33_07935 [bacterium]
MVDPEIRNTFKQYGRMLERIKKLIAIVKKLSEDNGQLKQRLAKLEAKASNDVESLELQEELKKLKSENKTLKEKETKIKTKIERLAVKLEQLHL